MHVARCAMKVFLSIYLHLATYLYTLKLLLQSRQRTDMNVYCTQSWYGRNTLCNASSVADCASVCAPVYIWFWLYTTEKTRHFANKLNFSTTPMKLNGFLHILSQQQHNIFALLHHYYCIVYGKDDVIISGGCYIVPLRRWLAAKSAVYTHLAKSTEKVFWISTKRQANSMKFNVATCFIPLYKSWMGRKRSNDSNK